MQKYFRFSKNLLIYKSTYCFCFLNAYVFPVSVTPDEQGYNFNSWITNKYFWNSNYVPCSIKECTDPVKFLIS